MSAWEGFSAKDISKFKRSNKTQVDNDSNKLPSKNEYKLLTANKASSKHVDKFSINDNKTRIEVAPVPAGALFSSHTMDDSKNEVLSSDSLSDISSCSSPSHNNSNLSSPTKSQTGPSVKNVQIMLKEDNSYELITTSTTIDATDNGNSVEHSDNALSLENFQRKQKKMEEQNKRRKEVLTKAIADRKKRTINEVNKLHQIQDELGHLDALLSNDVSILRNQIELASVEFNEAQKRYDQAETEFIEAKLLLFNKMEKKELLTEHLCRIIEANEQRKANKLSELMTKLEMVDEEIPDEKFDQVLESSVGINEITYAVCTTIKDPNKSQVKFPTAASNNIPDAPLGNIPQLETPPDLEKTDKKIYSSDDIVPDNNCSKTLNSISNSKDSTLCDNLTHNFNGETENTVDKLSKNSDVIPMDSTIDR